MRLIAIATIVALSVMFGWAWRITPGRAAGDQFLEIWRTRPWGTQVILDFYALELVLALWMLSDAAARGAWWAATVCLAAMPIFGAVPAAAYWLLAANH